MKGRKLKRSDERGALEGLPLYLIILVVIAGVGTAIIAGWMMSSQSTELGNIEVNEEDKIISTSPNQSLEIIAYDRDGNPLEGATVELSGCGVEETGMTGEDGVYKADGVNPDREGNIDVEVRYTGETTTVKTDEIIVSDN
ncbi:MAG: carboxypeptidase-like regulatory domain-containing protein [Candidatus Aenigmatarchaeota archaeon]